MIQKWKTVILSGKELADFVSQTCILYMYFALKIVQKF